MDLLLAGLAALISMAFFMGIRVGGARKERQLRALIPAIRRGRFIVHGSDRVVKEIIVTKKEAEKT
jgi:hypothetical protein